MVSRLRDARNALLATHVSGTELDDFVRKRGVPRPSFISRTAWRRALHAAMGYRGHPNCTQFFLEGALSDWAIKLEVVLDPSRPSQLYSPGAEFTQDLVGRLVRIPSHGLFRVCGPADVDTPPFRHEILDLVTVATPEWDVPGWADLDAPVAVEAEFLAFLIREDQAGPRTQSRGDVSGTTTVYLYPEVSESVPVTVLFEEPEVDPEELPPEPEEPDADPVEVDPQPEEIGPVELENGGAIVEGGVEAEPPSGPFPAIIASDVFDSLEAACREVLATGFKLQMRPLPQLVEAEVA
jgi:hypothetical protein